MEQLGDFCMVARAGGVYYFGVWLFRLRLDFLGFSLHVPADLGDLIDNSSSSTNFFSDMVLLVPRYILAVVSVLTCS